MPVNSLALINNAGSIRLEDTLPVSNAIFSLRVLESSIKHFETVVRPDMTFN